MRPPEFTGGNQYRELAELAKAVASMRPPEFTGGNMAGDELVHDGKRYASMRPPEFTGGNHRSCRPRGLTWPRFNEAAGIHRRKRA